MKRWVFYHLMIDRSAPSNQRIRCADFFKLLAGDCSLDVILPAECCQTIFSFCQSYDGSQDIAPLAGYISDYCPELANILINENDFKNVSIIHFISYLSNRITNIHAKNVVPLEPKIVHPYNPPKLDRAYYFHEHGCQLRKMRAFSVDRELPQRILMIYR